MKPQKRAQTPKPKLRAPTPPPHPPTRTSEFSVADVTEMGDEFIEEVIEPVADASELTAPAPASPPSPLPLAPPTAAAAPSPAPVLPPPSAAPRAAVSAPAAADDRDTEEVRYRRATLVSPISAQLAESMVSMKELVGERDPAAPLIEGDDVTRRVVEADQPEVIHETGSYTVEVLDDAAAEARRRVELAAALRGAPELAATLGPLHRVPFLTRNPEETLARSLPHGASALVEHIDGRRTLEQIFGDSGLHPRDALQITAALLRERIIRIV